MAVLFPWGFDNGPEITEVRDWLSRNNRPRAIKAAQEHLRAGYSSHQFLELVADLLETPTHGRRGRPKKTPDRWMEIKDLFDQVRESTNPETNRQYTYDSALRKVANLEGKSVSVIRRTLKFHDKAREEHDRICRDEYVMSASCE